MAWTWLLASSSSAWLPLPPDAATRSVAAQQADPASTANLYRRLLALRHAEPALVRGAQRILGGADGIPDGVLAVQRTDGVDELVTLAEMAGRGAVLDRRWASGWTVAIDTQSAGPREGTPFDGALDADTAIVLRRA